jgi:hypothetical protein
MQKTRCYRIVIRGELSDGFACAFEGMSLERVGRNTELTGDIVDQAHLHALLVRIQEFGFDLVSLTSREGEAH